MNTHQKINMRGDYSEFIEMTNELHKRYGLQNPNKAVNLNLLGYVIEAQKKLIEQKTDGRYRCYECSSERRRDVFHFRNPAFQNYISNPEIKKHASQLQELANYFYN